jgi:DNA adenine methylase Dam
MAEYLKSPLNYAGSKTNLLPQIFPFFPQKVERFYDLFCGGGSVFANVSLSFSYSKIIANDILSPLIQFWQMLKSEKWENIIAKIKYRNIEKTDKNGYHLLRDNFNKSKDPIDFFILVCCCTNNLMRFNKKFEFNQTHGMRHFNDSTEERLKKFHEVLFTNDKISFFNKSFFEIKDEIQAGDMVYLDPPYLMSEAGYNCYWSDEMEKKLYNFLDELDKKGIKFCLSGVSEHKGKTSPYLFRMKKYNIHNIEYNYDRVSRSGESNSQEIIVTNY